ncbi:MAG TPA: hypothetical protein VLB44_26670 [Kofleriaceae bacterium]|nr:hypothetical protein [Kofleriaceae bacterium]
MNRDLKTQTSLLALARTRRMQRALAHAYIHRDAPMPTLRTSLGFMTSTATTTDEVTGLGHTMSLLGISSAEGVAYVVEEIGPTDAPIIYRLWLRGPRMGHLVPIHAWYEQCSDPSEIRARIAAIATTLEPAAMSTTEAWMLSTRIVQRRALRVTRPGAPLHADGSGPVAAPIRKFALQLRVEPVSGHGASGHSTVTAFLRPNATLEEVWSVPGEPGMAIARVSYTGIPNGLGLSKDTMVLLTE